MFLKSVEMFGFKSFPERTKLDFESGITVVVGPNGCGKSNISDAVRWVFGERSTKALRSKKMEDVIFAGTEDRPASGFAEVSLTLDNTDRALDIDEDEVCVTRRIYRSGETEYMINKKATRLADLLEMFMDTGLGRDGYSLIGQGRIAEIVSAKSDERREIFEEAAGISKHRYRREEAEKNLAKAGENLVRLTDISTELESRIEPLRIASEKALQYIELSKEKTGLELGVWVNTLSKNETAIHEYDKKAEIVSAQKNECEIRCAEIERKINEIFNSTQSFTVLLDQKRREQEACNSQIAELRSARELERGEIAHRLADVERINEQIAHFERLISDSENTVAESKAEIEKKEQLCLELDASAAAAESELARLNTESGGAEQRFAALAAELDAASSRLNNAKIEEVRLASAVEQTALRISEHEQAISEDEPALKDTREDAKLLAADSAQIENDITTAKNSRAGNELKLQNLTAKLEALRSDISAAELSIGECLHRAQTFEDMEKQMEGYGGSVKAVLTRASNGGLNGICGVVARLITVPDKYAVAVETALGGALQNIVTETEEHAKYAISFLKNNDLGRATFLPITAVKGDTLPERDFAACAGYIGVASRLVGFDKKYTGIFDRLLGRTAICDDLDNAVSAAKKTGYRYRIVTLDGQVVNSGGSMTGGSVGKTGGTLSRANRITEYRERAKTLSKELETRKADFASTQSECERVKRIVDTGAQQLAGLSEEKLRIDLSFAQLNRHAEELEQSLKARKSALSELKKQLAADDKSLAAVRAEIFEASALYTAKSDESRELSEGRSDFFAKREEIHKKISDIRLDIAEQRKDISVLSQSIKMSGADKSEKLAMIDSLNSGKSAVTDGERSSLEKIAALEQQISELEAAAARLAAEAEAVISDRNSIEQRLTQTREQEKEAMQVQSGLVAEETRISERRASAQRDYDNTAARLWEEYSMTPDEAHQQAAPIENMTEATRSLARLREKIRNLGTVNTAAPEEYKEVSERYGLLKAQIDDIEKSRAELGKFISELNSTMTEMFIKTFDQINEKFKEVFVQLFGGGKAELILENPDDALNCGIEIKAQPPGKSIKSLELLSGGEQSFLAVAIYFAILKVKPSPFCLLDEIEAALDEVNVMRFAAYLRAMSENTQFIVITHRRGTMETGDSLLGITMRQHGRTGGVSMVLHLQINEVESKLGIKL